MLNFRKGKNNKRLTRMRYFPWMWRIQNRSNKQQILFEHTPNLTKKISMMSLSKELKLIASEINQFESRHTNNINWTFFACSAYQNSNLKDTVKICTMEEIFRNMSPSIQTWIDEFSNVVFAKVDLEYQDNSTLIELLPHLVNQGSKSDVEDNFDDF